LIVHEARNKRLKPCLNGYKDAMINILGGHVKKNSMGLRNFIEFKRLRVAQFIKL
jgi:hypothetical protein